jgi:hypothetical protein
MVILIGLLICAFFARGNGPAPMSIAPDPVVPGHEITVRFAEPQVTDAELMFEGNGTVHSLGNDKWDEVPDGESWQLVHLGGTPRNSIELMLPREVEPGSYCVCATTVGSSDVNLRGATTSLDDLRQLCAPLEVKGR